MKNKRDNSSMYSGIPCDECGGPTHEFASGSIWCPSETTHPGGHFVVRVAFERAPGSEAAAKGRAIASRPIKSRTPATVQKPITAPVGFGGGYDDFVESES